MVRIRGLHQTVPLQKQYLLRIWHFQWMMIVSIIKNKNSCD